MSSRVLLAEDEEALRLFVGDSLRNEGMKSSTPATATRRLRRQLVLLRPRRLQSIL